MPEFTDDEVAEVLAALRADAPALVAVLERQARAPGSVASADYDDVYDRMLTYLFERGYVHTHIEMAVLFRAVVAGVGSGDRSWGEDPMGPDASMMRGNRL